MDYAFKKAWERITKKEQEWITVHGAHIPIKDGESKQHAISARFSGNRTKPKSTTSAKDAKASDFKNLHALAKKQGISIHKTLSAMKKNYELAPNCKKHIDDIADSISKEVGTKMHPAKPEIKGVARAMEKAIADYGGDVTKVTDIARNTVICHDIKKFQQAIKLLREHPDMVVARLASADTDELGYSGGNFKVKAPNGMVGEIQVNTPDMIYAKEEESIARNILGSDVYNMINKKVGVEGGLGHKYYNEHREMKAHDPFNPKRKELEEKSRDYYATIRKHYYS